MPVYHHCHHCSIAAKAKIKFKKKKLKKKKNPPQIIVKSASDAEIPRARKNRGSTCARGMITCQFGAFLFGARQFDASQFGASQFGALHFDAVPVRRVSVWRDASLARSTLARFPFLCLTAQKCFLRQFGTYLVLRLC